MKKPLRTFILSLAVAASTAAIAQTPSKLPTPPTAAESSKNRPPNVVLILVDDLGWADLGCYGSTFHETPNLDALAKRGALFTDGYAASPVCSPTRASILSGKYPNRIGMSFLAGVSGPSGDSYKLIPPKVTGNIPPEDTTLAEALRGHGYRTAHIGKWHLQGHGEKGNANFPDKHGFDINIAGQGAGQPGSYYFPYKSNEHPDTDVRDMEDGKEGDYLTDALTTKAIKFIEDSAERPFFLNFWYYTVHTPIEPRKDKLEKYTAKAKSLDQTAFQPISEHQSLTRSVQNNPAYAAMVESLDENVGRIMDALRNRGLEDNTRVELLFTPAINQDVHALFLNQIAESDPESLHMVVMDQAGFHMQAEDARVPTNICLLPLPPYCPELNPAEWFGRVVKAPTVNRIYQTLEKLENHLIAVAKRWRVRKLIRRLGGKLRVPRKSHVKKDPKAAEAFRRSLAEAICGAVGETNGKPVRIWVMD